MAFNLYFVDKPGDRSPRDPLGAPEGDPLTIEEYCAGGVRNGNLERVDGIEFPPTYRATGLPGDFMEIGGDGNGYIYHDKVAARKTVEELAAKLAAGESVRKDLLANTAGYLADSEDGREIFNTIPIPDAIIITLAAEELAA